jgi:hypothetical protein
VRNIVDPVEAVVASVGRTVRAQAQVLADKAAKEMSETAIGGPAGVGGIGYRRQMELLHGPFPGLQLISGFRPGAITATGNASYHGKGRAVDIPPRMDVFNWIRSNYGASTKELIFSPANNRQVHNGRPHMYSGVTRRNHFDHVHWAMANGGVINEPVIGTGLSSGKSYAFGEKGPETVVPGVLGGRQRGGGDVHVHLTVQGSVMTERDLVRTVSEGVKRLGRQGYAVGAVA